MPKVSVIIPVYNAEKYLPKCLDSVINQTLEDIEIICVNDCSIDNSLQIAREYASRDSHINIIDLKENHGAGYARNRGIECSKGEYIGFVDSDDFIDLDFYEKLYNKALETNADIVKSNMTTIKNGVLNRNYYNIPQVKENKYRFNHAPSAIFKKCFLLEHKILYPEDLSTAEDSVFETLAASRCNKIEIVEDVRYFYRRIQNTLNRPKALTMDIIKDIEQSISRCIDIINELNIDYQTYYSTIKDRIKYLSFFIKDKNPSEEILQYTKNAERKLFSKLKYQEEIKKLQIAERVQTSWNSKLEETRGKSPKIVLSLTSYPPRMQNLQYTLYSLFNQTKAPDETILYLADEEFPNKESDIPKEILRYKDFGLEIKFSSNIKSYKKLIPALRDYPEETIITADDDIFYPKDWLEAMLGAKDEYPDDILCYRAHKIKFENGKIDLYKNWEKSIQDASKSFLNFPTTGGGVLYPPKSLYEDVSREDLFMELAPNADDIWFWAMAILNCQKIRIIKSNFIAHKNTLFSKYKLQNDNLYMENIVFNDIQMKKIINHYPEIIKILKQEVQNA